MTVGNPVDHGITEARQRTANSTNGRAAHDDEPVSKGVLEPLNPTGTESARVRDRKLAAQQVDDLGNREHAQSNDDQRHLID